MGKKRGRPSKYTPELAEKICRLIAEGKPLTKIVRMPGMPDYITILRWLSNTEFEHNEIFCRMYTQARQDQADTLADEIIEIADDCRGDFVIKYRKDGTAYVVPDFDHLQRARMKVDARKWIASKLKPKKYGDRIDVSQTGPDPLRTNVFYNIPDNGRD